ncbi:hypothetical protein LDENG_00251500 [Lucifuga dentata]|nr:hypothetical protein LDENG_00251500 [Lucifuga dentata]
MMEIKLRIAFCALLLINLGSAEHDDDPTGASSHAKSHLNLSQSDGPESTAAVPAPGSSLDPLSQTPAPSLNISNTNTSINTTSFIGDSSSSNTNNDTVTAGEINSVTPIIPHLSTPSQPNEDHATSMVPPSLPPIQENDGNLTNQSIPQPPIPPSENHTSTPPIHSTAAATTNPTHTSPTAPAHTLPTMPSSDMPHSVLPHTPPHSSHNKTHSSTSAPTSEPADTPHPTHPTKSETTIATTSSQSSSISSATHQETANSQPPQATSHSDLHPEISTVAHSKSTIIPPTSPSAQAKTHADTPSQLNVGGDATTAHESPTLDPLLTGLVSAFIITAVIVTLLLFLKLRRRDNRPEFRRLQDLPMDDMMEDTPLSMYSY